MVIVHDKDHKHDDIAYLRRSVTIQNLAFLIYRYRKKRVADALLTGTVS
jgi:hypothetical protein